MLGASIARGLRHRNYRLFFSGQSISLVGTWLTRVATSWLVYRLSHSAFALGLVSFAGQLPTFLAAPFAGVYIDRWNRHRVLVVTQVLAMLQSALLAGFTLTDRINVPLILALSVFQGLINAFDMPARQAFLTEMIEDRADLPNAIALNSSMFNLARLLGPSIAGVLIATVGEGGCFTVDALSYIAVIGSLLAMRLRPPANAAEKRTSVVRGELAEGLRYVSGSPPLRSVLLLLAVVSFVGVPYTTLLPMIATDKLHGDAHTLSLLMAASGLGALAGALYMASRTTVLGLGRVIALAAIGFGVSLILFAESRWVAVSTAFMVTAGLSMILQTASSNTVLQTLVDERMRGRVMSFYTMSIMGTAPFGSLFAGLAADKFGPTATLVVGGSVCVVAAYMFLRGLPRLREHARPTYQRLGILPEIASGLESATEATQAPPAAP